MNRCYKMMHCYSRNCKLLALIDINAISETTWHRNGIYIYWRKIVEEFEETTNERAGCIVCNWTKVEFVSQDALDYLKNHGTRIILEDTTIYDSSEFWNTPTEFIREQEEKIESEN